MAAMITSGLMFFSRLICSICWRSWLAIASLTGARELGFQARVGDLRQRDAALHPALLRQAQRHDPVRHTDETACPVPPSVHGLVARKPRQPSGEAAVVLLLLQRAVQSGRGNLERVGA